MATELGQAYVQIMPSAKGISGSISNIIGPEANAAGTAAGKSMGGQLMSTVKKIIVAAGIGKVFQESLMQGSDLQQSLGGIETLFKGSADKVKGYANQAYKTTGMSANAYMENVTSFSASLLQSVGGDTSKSADIANMAMVDMSDNANKMGTNMGDIQNAYQGFAKQNYTMLDNLKLGYGGTQAEMQRLLKDATKITGVKYDISNLADVYNAIHAVQGKLDITGTTAKEAASTFSGSMSAMKAAAQNVLGKMSLGMDIKPDLAALSSTISTFVFGNLIPMIMNIVTSLPTAIAGFLQSAGPAMVKGGQMMMQSLIQGLSTSNSGLASVFKPFISLLMNIQNQMAHLGDAKFDGLKSIFSGLTEVVKTLMGAIAGITNVAFVGLIDIAQKVGSAFDKVFGGSATNEMFGGLQQVIQELTIIVETAFGKISNVIEAVPWEQVFTAAKNAINGFVTILKTLSGILKSALNNDIVKSFGVAVAAMFVAFKGYKIVTSAVASITGVVGTVGKAVTAMKEMGGAISALKTGFSMITGFMGPAGWIVAGIAAVTAGLVFFFTKTKTGQELWQSFVTWLKDAWQNLSDVATTVWSAISDAFSGAVDGIKSAWSSVTDFFSGLWSSISNGAGAAADGARSVWSGLGEFFSSLWQGITDTASAVWTGITDTLSSIWQGIVTVAQNLWGTFGDSLTQIWNGIVQVAQSVWDLLKSVIMAPILLIVDLITGNFGQIATDMSMIWQHIVADVQGIWTGLTTYFSGVLSFIGTYFSTVWTGISTFAISIWTNISNFFINIWNGIVSGAQAIWQGLLSFLINLMASIYTGVTSAWNNIKSGVINAVNAIKSGAINAWNGLTTGISNLVNNLKAFVPAAWNAMKSSVVNIANGIKSGAMSAWNGMVSGVKVIIEKIKSAFNLLSHIDLGAAGRAIMESFHEGLTKAWGKVKDFVGGIGDWIRKHKGPISYDRKLLIPAGNAIMAGLNNGLQDSFAEVKATVSGMSGQLAAAMHPDLTASATGYSATLAQELTTNADQPTVFGDDFSSNHEDDDQDEEIIELLRQIAGKRTVIDGSSVSSGLSPYMSQKTVSRTQTVERGGAVEVRF